MGNPYCPSNDDRWIGIAPSPVKIGIMQPRPVTLKLLSFVPILRNRTTFSGTVWRWRWRWHNVQCMVGGGLPGAGFLINQHHRGPHTLFFSSWWERRRPPFGCWGDWMDGASACSDSHVRSNRSTVMNRWMKVEEKRVADGQGWERHPHPHGRALSGQPKMGLKIDPPPGSIHPHHGLQD